MLLAGLMVLTPFAPIPAMTGAQLAAVNTAATPHHDTVPQQIHADLSSTSAAIDQQACGDHQNCDGQCCAACAHCLSAVCVSALAPRWRGDVVFSHLAVLPFSFTPLLLERPPQSHA